MSTETVRHAWEVRFELERAESQRVLDEYELRACPWCGEKPAVSYNSNPDTGEFYYTLSCNNLECPAECSCVGNYVEDVVTNWNERFNVKEYRPVKFGHDYCDLEFE